MSHENGNGAAHAPAAPDSPPQTIEERLQALEDAHDEDHAHLENIREHLNTKWKPLRRAVTELQTAVESIIVRLTTAEARAAAAELQTTNLAQQVERLEEEAGELKAQLVALGQKFEDRLPPPRPRQPDGRLRAGRRKKPRGADGEILGSPTAHRLRDAMNRAGVSAAELAAQFKVEPRAVHRWMTGEREPKDAGPLVWIQSVNTASTDQLFPIRFKAQEALKMKLVAPEPGPKGDQ